MTLTPEQAEREQVAFEKTIKAYKYREVEKRDLLRVWFLRASQAEDDRLDALRYRWLRERHPTRSDYPISINWPVMANGVISQAFRRVSGDTLDALIDAAMVGMPCTHPVTNPRGKCMNCGDEGGTDGSV